MSGSKAGFSVSITAVDAATKQIDAINARIRAMQAPAERLTKSFGKLADNTGITKLAGGMRSVARESFQAFENIGRMVGPLGAITSAASLAGVAKLASGFGDFGNRADIAARRAGMAVEPFLNLGNAARLAGVSSDAMGAGLTALKDNIFDFNAGRAAPMTIAAFNTMGISLRDKVTGGLRSANEVLPELADYLKGVKDPTMRATLEMLTLGAAGVALDPLLRQGSAAIADLTKKAALLYGVTDKQIAQAVEFHQKTEALTIATEGLGIAIASDLLPVIGPVIDDMTRWITANRDWISSDIKNFVERSVPVIRDFAAETNDVATALGGWKTVLEGIVAITLIAWVTKIVASLNPLMVMLAAIVLTIEKIHAFSQQSLGELPVGSPLWANVPDEEQSNYVYSPRTQKNAPWLVQERPFNAIDPSTWLHHSPETGPVAPTTPGGIMPSWAPQGDRSLPRGIRNNNPLNLSYLPEQGAIGSDGRFGVYKTMEDGIAAEMKQFLINQDRHGTDTLAKQIYRWAPPSDNDTPRYLAAVSRMAGIPENVPIDMRNPDIARRVILAMTQLENGRSVPSDVVQKGIDKALGADTHITPAGDARGEPINIQGGTGTAGGPGATTTVKGSANLSIKLDGFPFGTQTAATTSGDLFSGAPLVEQAMPLGRGP